MKNKLKFESQLVKIRKAKVSDIPALLVLENACFNYDQLGRRNFHWMIKKANSIFLVLEYKSELIGYGLVLINRGTSLARLYSICTLKEYQGHGLASKIIQELENKAASDQDCAYLRLEVKENNHGAIKLYEKLGYQKFTEKEDYYDDGQTALCFEKRIRVLKKRPGLDVPYHQQGTDFTCGPSCLLMAMKAFNPKFEMSLSNELQIWREATTIFMTSGHGGCGPHGLALSAWRRGYKAEMYLSHSNVLFLDSVRSQEKKKVIELVHKDFEKRIAETNVKVHRKRLTLSDLKDILKGGGIPLVLITTYHFDNNRAPHWVVVTAYDDHFVYIHDPDQHSHENHIGVISRIHIPIQEDQFLKISRWGKDRMAATVVVYPE
ncbi:GNAT family N-acetyltransferase/peptidase C39 family protein [Peredibacter sp. HCB2-198]|uniref:GNAT family N-acetyltransferase/peptidase C39 family protein n=1 Tax=Peredibacter sp. HCB2-198 TaxID=3383025 RepID=UPI0038B4664C